MYCANCGHRYSIGGGFCPQCGALFADSLTGLDSTESRRPACGVPWVPWGWIQVSLGILLVIALGLAVVSSLVSILEVSPPQAAVFTSATLGLIVLAVVWVLGLRGQSDKLRLLGLTRVGWPGRRSVSWTLLIISGSLAFSSVYVLTVRWLGLDVLLPPAHEKLVFSGPAVGLSFLAPGHVDAFNRGDFFPGLRFRRVGPAMGGPGSHGNKRPGIRLLSRLGHRNTSLQPRTVFLHRRARRAYPHIRYRVTVCLAVPQDGLPVGASGGPRGAERPGSGRSCRRCIDGVWTRGLQ